MKKLQRRRDRATVTKNTRVWNYSSWTLTKLTGEGNDKRAGTRMNSVVDGQTNYLTSLFMWVKKRRERLKITATRDVTNGRQGKNLTEVTATKKGGGTTRMKSERRVK